MDDSSAFWRCELDPAPILADPDFRVGSSLMGVADKLAAVLAMLNTLNADDDAERDYGLAVAGLAIEFAFAVLDRLGLTDDDGPPPFVTCAMAQFGIANVLAFVRDELEAWQMAAKCHDCATAQDGHAANGPSRGLVIDRDRFEILYNNKPCFLGNTFAFHLMARFDTARGTFLSIKTLIDDVWKGKDVSDEAVQRQISTLRAKLKDAGIDGIEFEAQHDAYRMILR